MIDELGQPQIPGRRAARKTSLLVGLTVGLPLLIALPLAAAPILNAPGQDDEIAAPVGLQGHVLRDILTRLNAGEVDDAIDQTEAVIRRYGENAAALELLGAALALNGDLDLAVVKLERAVELNPAQSSAYTKLGDIFRARRQNDLAERSFRQAVEINDGDRRAHQRLGLMLGQGGAVDEAIDHLKKGLIGLPADYVGIKVDLARLYNLKGEHSEALGLLNDKLTPARDDARAFMVRGTSKLGLGKTDDALADFSTARALAPDDPGILLAEGIALREMGRMDDSRRALEASVDQRPDWSLGLFQLAMTQRAQNDHDRAIASLDKALAADPGAIAPRIERARYALERGGMAAAVAMFDRGWPKGEASPDLFGEIGEKLQREGRFDLAEAVLIAGAGRFADDPVAQYQLGRYYGLVQRYDQAVLALEAAAERAPGNPEILKTLSLAYQRRGELPKAIDAAARLTEITDHDVDDMFYLASLRDELGQTEEAKRLYREVLTEDAGHVASLNNLAVLLIEQQPRKALSLARRAAELAPEAGYVIDTLGMAFLADGQNGEAIDALERANQLTPDEPLLLYHLALARHERGDSGAAREHLARALALSTDFEGAGAAAALLRSLR